MGCVVQVGQQMYEIQDCDEAPRQQMHLKQRPVVLLAVADAGLAAGPVQATPLYLCRHLPTERVAVGHGRHHRTHTLVNTLLASRTLLLAPRRRRRLGAAQRRATASLYL